MGHPMFCGSLLYQWFGGSANKGGLADVGKKPIEFGADERTPGGEVGRLVKFYGTGLYGNVEALIGKESGFVYRITYDSAELTRRAREMGQDGSQVPGVMRSVEKYKNIQADKQIDGSTFAAKAPKGFTVVDAAEAGRPPSPIPVGQPAPDAEFIDLSGKKVRLSSLKGKVVLIDFWATWCAPCREGLPVTDKFHRKYGDKGLAVLAVSMEDKPTVAKFIDEYKFAFRTVLDPEGRGNITYKIEAIPTTVIIDAKGNLSSYLVGLPPEERIADGLRKAGLKL